jgi:hypothetical protein
MKTGWVRTGGPLQARKIAVKQAEKSRLVIFHQKS